MLRIFENRREAGRLLAEKLLAYADRDGVIVLGLPRGGVPVAYEVAQRLRVPLDVFLVRKLGVPGQEELAFGAIASGGGRVLNSDLVRALRLPDSMIQRVASSENIELNRRDRIYRGDRPFPDLTDKTVIVVDDGLATGASMRAAVEALRKLGPKEIVVAVPVCARQTCDSFDELADVVCVCAATPEPFYGVGMWYRDFSQTSDAEVHDLLERSRSAPPKRNHG